MYVHNQGYQTTLLGKRKASIENDSTAANTPIAIGMHQSMTELQEKSVSTPQRLATLKNNNKNIHPKDKGYRSQCILCGEADRHMVRHYVKKHPNAEVFISRPSPRIADEIRNQSIIRFQFKEGKLNGFCYFCEEEKIFQHKYWLTHLSTHTGEQVFHCMKCNVKMSQIQSHNSDCDLSRDIRNIYNEQLFELNYYERYGYSIIGHMCKLCNYVQLLESNLARHVKNEHFINTNGKQFYEKVFLVKDPSISTQNLELSKRNDIKIVQSAVGLPGEHAKGRQSSEVSSAYGSLDPFEADMSHMGFSPGVYCSEVYESASTNVSQNLHQSNFIQQQFSASCGWQTTNSQFPQTLEGLWSPQQQKYSPASPNSNNQSLCTQNSQKFSFEASSSAYYKWSPYNSEANVSNKPAPNQNQSPLVVQKSQPFENTEQELYSFEIIDDDRQNPFLAQYIEQIEPAIENTEIEPEYIDIEQLIPYIKRNATSNWTKVKPWIDGDGSIKENIRLDMLLALFKCMHRLCKFSTDDATRMTEHIDLHLKAIDALPTPGMQIECLECAYCTKSFMFGATLAAHIENEHSDSIFQCANCFYRTIEIENIIGHTERYHKDDGERKILLCPRGERVIDESTINSVYERFERSCGQSLFKCGRCDEFGGCFSINDLREHLIERHGNQLYVCGDCGISVDTENYQIEKHGEEHGLFEFHCIHCTKSKYEVNDAQAIKWHMADHHPNQFLFVASRRIESNIVDMTYPPEIIHLYEIRKYSDSLGVGEDGLEPKSDGWTKIELDSPLLKTTWRNVRKAKEPMSYDVYLKRRNESILIESMRNEWEEEDIKPDIRKIKI